jgi:hypothetical protein
MHGKGNFKWRDIYFHYVMRGLLDILRKYLCITFYLYGFSDYYMSQGDKRKIKYYANSSDDVIVSLCYSYVLIRSLHSNSILFFVLCVRFFCRVIHSATDSN